MNEEQPVVEVSFDKENFESYFDFDITISDSQWQAIQSELEGRLWNFFEELVGIVVQDVKEGQYDDC